MRDSGGRGPSRSPCWRTPEESCKGLGSVTLKMNTQHTHGYIDDDQRPVHKTPRTHRTTRGSRIVLDEDSDTIEVFDSDTKDAQTVEDKPKKTRDQDPALIVNC